MDLSTCPNELLFKIFRSLDFLAIVKARRVCRQWNDVSCEILNKLKIIYCYDSVYDLNSRELDWDELAPWLSNEERIEFSRSRSNTVITLDVKKLVSFIANHCAGIEAFVDHGNDLSFTFFAKQIGPRMRFFHGPSSYKWCDSSNDILRYFPRLEHFPGTYGPCNLVQLQYNLPLKCITSKCRMHSYCTTTLLAISIDPAAANNASDPKIGRINRSFAQSIKVLRLNCFREKDSEFCFPNLEHFSSLSGMDQPARVFKSLEKSPKLKSLKFTGRESHCLRVVGPLTILMDKLPNLECLEYKMPLRHGDFYRRYEDEDGLYEAICRLILSCRKLYRLVLPFNLYSELELAVQLFGEFYNLTYFRCRQVSEEFLRVLLNQVWVRYVFTNDLDGPPDSKKLTVLGEMNGNAPITNQDLHDVIDVIGESGILSELNINFYCLEREHDCFVTRIVPISGDPLLDQNFIDFS